MKFSEWIKLREMMGSVGAIVSCKDCNNASFQIQGALCSQCGKKNRTLKMRFNKDKKTGG